MRTITLADCQALDEADVLRPLREQFIVDPNEIYPVGNSLGLLAHAASERVRQAVVEEWGNRAVRAWQDWIDMPERIGSRIARLIGASSHEVTVADSTSVNLFKLAAACQRAAVSRSTVVTEAGNFPTDLYVLQGLRNLLGPNVELRVVPREEVLTSVDSTTSLVVLTHVHYKTGEMWDIPEVSHHIHASGARVLWDLSHSVGVVPMTLNSAGADFAVGCTYKYLNGGPGAPAFLYVRGDLLPLMWPAIPGWMGHADPFDMSDDCRAPEGIRRHRSGTPAILGLAALEGSLSVFDGVDLSKIRHKSLRLSEIFIDLVAQECTAHSVALLTPYIHVTSTAGTP